MKLYFYYHNLKEEKTLSGIFFLINLYFSFIFLLITLHDLKEEKTQSGIFLIIKTLFLYLCLYHTKRSIRTYTHLYHLYVYTSPQRPSHLIISLFDANFSPHNLLLPFSLLAMSKIHPFTLDLFLLKIQPSNYIDLIIAHIFNIKSPTYSPHICIPKIHPPIFTDFILTNYGYQPIFPPFLIFNLPSSYHHLCHLI